MLSQHCLDTSLDWSLGDGSSLGNALFSGKCKVLVSTFHWSSHAFSSPWTLCLSLPTCPGGDIRALGISQKGISVVWDSAVSESQASREDGTGRAWGSSVLQKLGPVSCAVQVWITSYKEWRGLASVLNWFLRLWHHQPPSLVCIAAHEGIQALTNQTWYLMVTSLPLVGLDDLRSLPNQATLSIYDAFPDLARGL